MGLQIQGNGGTIAEVGGTTFRSLNTQMKPIEYGALGHYRTAVRIVLTAAQAANSRLFEIRNNHASNLIIPTRLNIRVMQIAAGTAQENAINVFKWTGVAAVDTTNTVTPVSSVKRTTEMAAYPGTSAQVRHLTLAGAAAGMTGGFAATKDTQAFFIGPFWVNTAVPTAPAPNIPYYYDVFDDVNGTHPFALKQSEGLTVENSILNVTTYGMIVYIDFAWADVAAF